MIERYTRARMGAIWSDESRFRAWLEVEILACEAWARLGEIPAEDAARIRASASFDIGRIAEIERETRHDVVAFTRAVSESLGEERKWVHYGLTSTDVVDTALSFLLGQASDLLLEGLEGLKGALAERAREHMRTIMMGRTHGAHAEPTTFGLKLALWHEETKRNIERFKAAARGVRVGKVSGAVGTFAHAPPAVEAHVCERLGLEPDPISTQTLQRDRHAHYVAALALIATSIEKMAVEIRHLQRTEVREAEEPFARGQKGSSAMPHKRNPIGCENMSGLARVIRGHMAAAYENVALWHERDISHSSAERIILPDSTILLDYMLDRFAGIIRGLRVLPESMLRNMGAAHGLVYSQRVLLALVGAGLSREEAYDLVQPLAMRAWEEAPGGGSGFRELAEADAQISARLSPEQIADCFDPAYHVRRVDEIFERAGLS